MNKRFDAPEGTDATMAANGNAAVYQRSFGINEQACG
jgi:hypothetical protein